MELGKHVAERLFVLRPKAQDLVLAVRFPAFVVERRIGERRVLGEKRDELSGIVGRAFFEGVQGVYELARFGGDLRLFHEEAQFLRIECRLEGNGSP